LHAISISSQLDRTLRHEAIFGFQRLHEIGDRLSFFSVLNDLDATALSFSAE
jgi:hypothetical protein